MCQSAAEGWSHELRFRRHRRIDRLADHAPRRLGSPSPLRMLDSKRTLTHRARARHTHTQVTLHQCHMPQWLRRTARPGARTSRAPGGCPARRARTALQRPSRGAPAQGANRATSANDRNTTCSRHTRRPTAPPHPQWFGGLPAQPSKRESVARSACFAATLLQPRQRNGAAQLGSSNARLQHRCAVCRA